MSLKTKLVLAITGLVFLVTAVLSLVYVSKLLESVVQESYDTNKLGAEQIRYALQLALEDGLKDQQVNPNDQEQLRNLAARAVRNSVALKAVVNSVIIYSPTVYDISIETPQTKQCSPQARGATIRLYRIARTTSACATATQSTF